jgi:hypothetical protein
MERIHSKLERTNAMLIDSFVFGVGSCFVLSSDQNQPDKKDSGILGFGVNLPKSASPFLKKNDESGH